MRVALLTLGVVGWLAFAEAAVGAQEVVPVEYKPIWKAGQTWCVETVSRQSPVCRDTKALPASKPVRWHFEVRGIEEIDGAECFKVVVKCLVAGQHPVAIFWVDQRSMTLRRVQTELPAPEGPRMLTESYRSASGQPFPAFAPSACRRLSCRYSSRVPRGRRRFRIPHPARRTVPRRSGKSVSRLRSSRASVR